MDFSDKLSTLLSLTTTKNAELAKALNIDHSQVSRMKTGTREKPRKPALVHAMAEYFAKHCVDERRLSVLITLTGDIRLQGTLSQGLLAEVIFDWLWQTETGKDKQKPPPETVAYQLGGERVATEWTPKDFAIYYGNEGKRHALEDFIALVLAQDKPVHVLIATDENTAWFSESQSFVDKLPPLLSQCIAAGHTCTHILSPHDNIDDFFATIRQWLPAYRNHAIRQYYYPGLIDRLFRLSLFIIPDVAALCSQSFGTHSTSHLSTLTTVSDTTKAFERMFGDYLALCRPVVNISANDTTDQLMTGISAFIRTPGDGAYHFPSLSPHTMPAVIMKRLHRQVNSATSLKLYQTHLQCMKDFASNLLHYQIEEIITLVPLKEVLAQEVVIPGSTLLGKRHCYQPDEYLLHLETIIELLETYEHYQVLVAPPMPDCEGFALYTQSMHRVHLIKQSEPQILYEIVEPHLASLCCDFLHRKADKLRAQYNREKTIALLEGYISKLKGHDHF